jgi:hypothetical protein
MRGLAAVAMAGVPLATAISCDSSSFSVIRVDDDRDCGHFDFICEHVEFVDECIFGDCHDDDFFFFD